MNVRARGTVRVALLAAGIATVAFVTLAATAGSAATRHAASASKAARPAKDIPGPRGPRGPRGPAGTKGAKGDPATALWALVASNGTLIKGSSVATITRSGSDYRVIFNRDVTNCATIATPTQAIISAADIVGPSTVAVAFRTSSDVAESEQFSLAVFC
jgi:hypothetical protein